MFPMEHNNTPLEEVKSLCISAWEELKAAFDYVDRASRCTDKEIIDMFNHISCEEFKHAAMHIAKLAKLDNNFYCYLVDFMESENIVEAEMRYRDTGKAENPEII